MNAFEFLGKVTDQIRSKTARSASAEELKQHIEDQADVYESMGMDRGSAVEEAVRDMGDPIEVGMELDRVHRPRPQWKLIAVIGVLCMVRMLLPLVGKQVMDMSFLFGIWDNIILVLAFIMMIGIYYLDYSIIGRYSLALWYGCLGLMAINLLCTYLRISFFDQNITNDQMIYLLIPLYAGILFRYRNDGYRGVGLSVMHGIPLILIAVTTSLPMRSLIVIVFQFLMLTVAVYKQWFGMLNRRGYGITWSIPVLGSLFYYLIEKTGVIWYRIDGVTSFRLSVTSDQKDAYMSGIIKEQLANAKMFGSTELPEAFLDNPIASSSNCMLVILISKIGIVAGAVVIALIAVLLVKLFMVSIRQKNSLGFMIAAACSFCMLIQYIIYIAGNLGVVSLMGGHIPFLGYGRQGLIVDFILLGLMLSIFRNENTLPEAKKYSINSTLKKADV